MSLTSDLPIVKKYASSLLGIISFPSAVLAVILEMSNNILVQIIFRQAKKMIIGHMYESVFHKTIVNRNGNCRGQRR
jgi:hypothetical protein